MNLLGAKKYFYYLHKTVLFPLNNNNIFRHMSGLSEGDHGQFGPSYNYRSDSYSGGSYGSPDQGGGYPLHVHDGRDFRYASMSLMPGSGMDSSHR